MFGLTDAVAQNALNHCDFKNMSLSDALNLFEMAII